ncbi:MurR/RpiR family transcriptional regulator [Limimaricola pyoseonensis]|uniref:DNA-binding transcriptional regulator, MurR/RpiR family, contains HTH and SIS domains n=1 Tax=Limimaricola pyoseonensis TaxID=521013 RepID=A0A1G7FSM1_9RHOB|nr:MurR/RpiR family transcriptional regulator [Limimaricola pyoseonensis]SDE78901.1 DNA-binding transcriptional regulator, MurR/RpiR family, contains HTH and SIS domains [Limimaricola pyoseonensis]
MTASADQPDAPNNVTQTIERLDELIDTLPKRLNQCATFTRRHLHLIAVSTVSDMARAAEVAPSVYMRFCQALGFSGYSEMQALFRAQYTGFRPAYDERLATLRPEMAGGTGRLLAEFAEAGHKSLISLANTVTSGGLEAIAQALAEAPLLHLVGMRRAYAVVSNMSYMLGKLEVPAVLHSDPGRLGGAAAVAPGHAVFAVTYASYSQETLDFAQAARARGARVYGLSDAPDGPLTELVDGLLVAHEGEVAGFRSLNASMTLATTLVVAVAALRDQD